MITIQGKQFRNFAEQIKENKENIANIDKGAELKAYLALITGEVQSTGHQYYGYTILYLPHQIADRYETEQTLPSHIQFTYSEIVPGETAGIRNSLFTYDYTTSELRDMLSSLILDIGTIHLEEITY